MWKKFEPHSTFEKLLLVWMFLNGKFQNIESAGSLVDKGKQRKHLDIFLS
jgi:hypothetical protein